ncbi:MAG: restriction endonuclease subunit S [Bacteroidetes bacterium]|nr:restriction endonuclease subunit S [Bacteroidota bacterium]
MNKWHNVVIDDCCDILDHLRVPVNGQDRQNMKGDIPYYGANGLQGYINDFIFNEDLILIAEDGGNFEEYDTRPIAYKISGKSWVNNHAHILKAKPEYCQDYIFYSLVNKNIVRFIAGGTRSKLNKSELIKIPIYCPQNPVEQQKIAQILSTTDTVIEKTQAAIAKYKAIKQGMLNDLFTRGIDIKTGKLRPKQEDAPELYKESELGWIPKEWAEKEIKEIGDVISGATPSTTNPDFWGGEIVWITPADLSKQKDAIYFQKASRKITELGLQNCSANLISENNLVISSRAPIGYLSIVKVPFTINQGCKSIKFFENEVPEYYYYNLLFNLNRLKNFGEGTTFAEISKDDFEIFTLPVCKEIEQKLISNKLQTVDNSINSEQTYLQKLQQIKSGLMEDLLSGNKLVSMPKEMETQTT